MKEWNPRFVAYALSQGRDPEAQLAYDEEAYPGGKMCGFMLFISEKWQTFSKLRPDLVPGTRGWDRRVWLSLCHADQFDAWLQGGLPQGGGPVGEGTLPRSLTTRTTRT
jgi:hypothetical protein